MIDLRDIENMIQTNKPKKDILKAIKLMREESIYVQWSIEDILSKCKLMPKKYHKCTRKQAIEIARIMEKHVESDYGINWIYLQNSIENYFNK